MNRNRDPIDVQVGANLRRARRAADLTQEDIAGALGVARSSVANIESGHQPLTVVKLVRAAEALGVKPAALLATRARPGAAAVSTAVVLRRARTQLAAVRRRLASTAGAVDGELASLDVALERVGGDGR